MDSGILFSSSFDFWLCLPFS